MEPLTHILAEILWTQDISQISDLVSIIVGLTTLALSIGSVVTLRQKGYHVEPTVSGVLATADGATLLTVTVKVKNVGLLAVGIDHDNSYIRIWKVDNKGERSEVKGSPRGVFIGRAPDIKKVGISRNSTLTEVHSVVLSEDEDDSQASAYQIRLRIAVKGLFRPRKPRVWNDETVVLRGSTQSMG